VGIFWTDRSVGDGVIELWFWSVLGVDGDSRCGQAWEEFERAEKMSCCIGICALVNLFVLQTRLLTTDAFSCLYSFSSVYFLFYSLTPFVSPCHPNHVAGGSLATAS